MGVEIERKFLIKNDSWKNDPKLSKGQVIKQGYISLHPNRTVRARVKGEKAFLTIKGKAQGLSRLEFEYEVPQEDALAMIKLCEDPVIEKTRYEIQKGEVIWEIDVFEGDNAGLEVAEVELKQEDQVVELPDWVGEEVSGDTRYINASLVQNPFKNWGKD